MWGNIWKDPVWSKVIATALIAVAAAGSTYFLNLWSAIGNWFGGFIALILSSSYVPNWLLGGMILLCSVTLFFLGAAVWSVIHPSPELSPNWLTYNTDFFFGLRWRWRYGGGSITDLHTFCPNCDYQVFPEHDSAYSAIDRIAFNCDICHKKVSFDGLYDSLESKAERLIHQKIRTGSWDAKDSA
jgi:hypothetical protein